MSALSSSRKAKTGSWTPNKAVASPQSNFQLSKKDCTPEDSFILMMRDYQVRIDTTSYYALKVGIHCR
jgi:hypothetical protein